MSILTVTSLAVPPSVLIYAGVLLVVWMAVWAVRFAGVATSCGTWSVASHNIIPTRHRLQMLGVDAGSAAASLRFNMVDLHARRDRTDEKFVNGPVSFNALAVDGCLPISIAIKCTDPQPARVGLTNMFPDPLLKGNRRPSSQLTGSTSRHKLAKSGVGPFSLLNLPQPLFVVLIHSLTYINYSVMWGGEQKW